jgi:hypothetical protein
LNRSGLGLFVFGGDFGFAFEGSHQGVPGKNGAFDAGGELVDTGEHGQFADIAFDLASGHHFMDLFEDFLNLGFALSFDAFSEQRGRSFGDAATRANEAGVFHHVALGLQKQLQLIATEWIVSLRGARSVGKLMKIARFFAMIQDDLLVEITKVVEHGN